ncbi:ribonuclease H [Trifolium pratense]|uniref:Ribonuclease H n=1 Tax=Trifolium pratense TaxID=57577 RepID=A0A2K3PIP0_TRIPR|nr:ribonuclease H [Trifolium pratense]
MNCDGTPGPDGFSGHLFQFFWETIAADVVKSIHHFFLNDMLQNNVNSNLLILIPKTPGAYRVDMFRPIALANFQFKIITKFLADSKVVGYFNCTRGVRQGDPLSPLLVCIAEEVLGRSITKAAMDGQLCLMILCRGTTIPTHVLYVDDIMIFCKGTKRKIRSVLRIFNSYGAASRQVINNAKSKFYAGAISNSRLVNIAPQLGFNMGSLPFTYLGCPIFVGKPLKQYIFKLWRIGLKRN